MSGQCFKLKQLFTVLLKLRYKVRLSNLILRNYWKQCVTDESKISYIEGLDFDKDGCLYVLVLQTSTK